MNSTDKRSVSRFETRKHDSDSRLKEINTDVTLQFRAIIAVIQPVPMYRHEKNKMDYGTNRNRDFDRDESDRCLCSSLTGNDEASLGGGQSGFAGKSMLGAALIGLVSVFRSNVADVQLAGRQHQVFAICRSPVAKRKVHRLILAAPDLRRVTFYLGIIDLSARAHVFQWHRY